jgi:hypothetical protein
MVLIPLETKSENLTTLNSVVAHTFTEVLKLYDNIKRLKYLFNHFIDKSPL